MTSNVYVDPQNTEFRYAIARGARVGGKESGYFVARFSEGSTNRKRVAPSIIPLCSSFFEAQMELEKHAKRMQWTLAGTIEVT